MIQGNRVTLKVLEQQDMQPLLDLVDNPDVSRLMIYNKADFTVNNIHNLLLQTAPGTQCLSFGIYRNDTGAFIGFVCINDIHPVNRVANLRFLAIDPSCWNEGYAEVAGDGFIRHLFLDRNIRRITATSSAGNETIEAIFRNGGFKHEGTDRKSIFIDGKWTSVKRWGLMKKEFAWDFFNTEADEEEEEDGKD